MRWASFLLKLMQCMHKHHKHVIMIIYITFQTVVSLKLLINQKLSRCQFCFNTVSHSCVLLFPEFHQIYYYFLLLLYIFLHDHAHARKAIQALCTLAYAYTLRSFQNNLMTIINIIIKKSSSSSATTTASNRSTFRSFGTVSSLPLYGHHHHYCGQFFVGKCRIG